jgi:hypothetical protein
LQTLEHEGQPAAAGRRGRRIRWIGSLAVALVVSFVGVGLFLTSRSDSRVVTVTPSADTTLQNGGTSNASAPTMTVGGQRSPSDTALLAFRLPALAANHQILEARLELTTAAVSQSEPAEVEVTIVPTIDWDDTVTWDAAPDLETGAVPAGTHSVATDDGGRLWIELAPQSIQALMDGPATIVLSTDGSTTDPAVFHTMDTPEEDLRPRLTIVTSGIASRDEGLNARLPPIEEASLPPGTVARINAGASTAVTDADGYQWQPDGGYVGDQARTYDTGADIAGTSMDAVFGTGRADPVAYSLPVPDGCYLVQTHHVEADPDIGVGDRIMGVWVEGDVATVDAFAEAGALAVHTEVFDTVDVDDGTLDLRFAGYAEEAPTVAGIEVTTDTGCGAPATSNDVDVKELVEDAVAAGERYIRIPPGEHRVDDTIVVSDGDGIVIDASDADLTFTCTQDDPDGCSAFRFTGQGATLRGATIDFDPLPFTQGVVTAKSGTTVLVALDAGFPDVDRFVRTSRQHQLHFDANGDWKKPVLVYASVAKGEDSRTARLSVQPTQILDVSVGDRIVLTGRGGQNAIDILYGDGEVRLEQVTLRSATGLAVYSQHWRGDVILLFPTVEPGPRPEGATHDRLISTNQDALRWSVNRSGPTVYGADISRQGDDGINFHGYPFRVEKVESSRSVVLRPFVRWVTPTEVFAPGDRVRFIDVPGSVVSDVRQISDIEELPTSDDRPRYRVTFDDPADVSVGQVADIPEHNSPNAVVRGSWFHDHAANGMRVKGDGWVVDGNAFEHIVSGNGVLALPHVLGTQLAGVGLGRWPVGNGQRVS